MTDEQDGFAKLFERQASASEVIELCRRCGAAFVIDTARAYVERKERDAAAEHQRWRSEMLATTGAKP